MTEQRDRSFKDRFLGALKYPFVRILGLARAVQRRLGSSPDEPLDIHPTAEVAGRSGIAPDVELVIDEQTNPLRQQHQDDPPTPPLIHGGQEQVLQQVQSFDDLTQIRLLCTLYPMGMDITQVIRGVEASVGDVESLLTTLRDRGLTTSDGQSYSLTDLGIRNVHNYLVGTLQREGIARFYELVQPYLELGDAWTVTIYNEVMRRLIFSNYDTLNLLASEHTLDGAIRSIMALRRIPPQYHEAMIAQITQLFRSFEALNLITVREEGDADVVQITEDCRKILSTVSSEMQDMFRGGYEMPITTPRLLLDETNQLIKRFLFLGVPMTIGASIVVYILNLDLMMSCAGIVGVVLFLSLMFLYMLNRI